MKKHQFLYLYLYIAFLAGFSLSTSSLSAAPDYLFRQLSISEGMPASVQNVYAERDGFVWVATKQGLGRFDGYDLKMFLHDADDPYSLPGNEVYQIVEDSLRNIWVLTNGGLATYDKKSGRFLRSTDGGTVKATAACRWQGGMFFSARDALFFYDYHTRQIKKIDLSNRGSLVKEIIPWDEHTLLCLRLWEGLFLLDVRTGKMHPAPIPQSEQISRMLLDSRQQLWVASYNKGVSCFDREGNLLGTYHTGNSDLSHNIILCMVEYEEEIWLGTDGGGINILNPKTRKIRVLPYVPGDKNSLPDNSLQSMYVDGKNLWVGGVKSGLIFIHPSSIRSYMDVPLNAHTGLSDKAVLSFCQEKPSDEVWIGTDGGGVNSFNPQTRQFTHYPKTWGEKVSSLCPLNERELLTTLFSKGMYAFDKQAGTFRKVKSLASIEQEAMYDRKSIYVYRESPSSILILSSDIHRYFPATNQVRKLTSDEEKAKGVFTVIGQEGPYTYLHDIRSIYSLNIRNDRLQVLYSVDKTEVMKCACRDLEGKFWVGTPDGLRKYDPVTRTTLPLEYPVKGVSALLFDNGHRLWIGSEKGLHVWLPARKKLITLGESDGVQPNVYTEQAVLNASQGGIFIGGINGMVCINEDMAELTRPDLPTLSLGDIITGEHSVLGEVDDSNRELKCPVRQDLVSVKLLTHTTDRFRKRTYRWRIEGAVRQETESREPQLTLHTLSPGTYHIYASCSTKESQWMPMTHIVTFSVPPAWYQTWWFILGCVFLIAGNVVYWVWRGIRRKEEKLLMVLKEHKQQVYEEKVRFLININHELRTPLTLIHGPLLQIMQHLSPDDTYYLPLKKVLKQTRRMKGLLDMVLSLRKMEMKETKLQFLPHPLNEWLQDTVNDFQYEGTERNIRLDFQPDPAIGEVCFDKEKNVIILTNFLVNAFKHSPDGSVITVRTELKEAENKVRISVMDQGEGLKGVDINQLFTRFYQGEGVKEGAGIGLSYAQILVEEHQGQIGASNNPDGGACFWYELPIHQVAGQVSQPQEYLNRLMPLSEPDKETDTPVTDGIDTRKYTCLFVDDNKELREWATETYQERFKKFFVASDGQEALMWVKREIPDVVISDIMMPRMDGYELCKHIKEDAELAYIQVILLTARTDGQSHTEGYNSGADAYVEKPFEPEALLGVVRNRLFLREQLRFRYSPVTQATDVSTNSADDAFLYKVNKLIETHLSEETLDISYLCEQMHTSRASFFNRIKALTGMGPNNYINKFRIEHAAEMLRQGELNMTEIAERTGFSTSRYFSTTFKKYMGATPTQYKNGKEKPEESV